MFKSKYVWALSAFIAIGVSAHADRESINDVYYGQTNALKFCGGAGGGTISTGCNDHGECFVNIKNSQCAGLRLYDSVVRKDGDDFYFQKTLWTEQKSINGSDGSYTQNFKLKTYEWERNSDPFSRYKYYVTAFLHRTDRERPYEKVLLWFTHKPR